MGGVDLYSVVVATYNRAQNLKFALKNLLAQEVNFGYEIIVVDNNSSDETRSIVRDLEAAVPGTVRYVFERQQGLSNARNAGIAAAMGEIIVFVDDDVQVHPGWLMATASAYRTHPDACCVGGRILLALPERCPSWFDPFSETLVAHLSGQDHGTDIVKIEYPDVVLGANFSVTRNALDRVGVFNTRLGYAGSCFIGGEEADLCHRIQQAGGSVYYCGEAVVTHIVPPTRMTKEFMRKRAYWAGRTYRKIFPPGSSDRGMWRALSKRMFASGESFHRRRETLRWSCRFFEYELKAWERVGSFHQALFP